MKHSSQMQFGSGLTRCQLVKHLLPLFAGLTESDGYLRLSGGVNGTGSPSTNFQILFLSLELLIDTDWVMMALRLLDWKMKCSYFMSTK